MADLTNHQRARRRRKLADHGLELEHYEVMLKAQGDGCAICGVRRFFGRHLSIDHDHATGIVRGLLCGNCNSGLGSFHDDVARLKAAIWYLEHPPAVAALSGALSVGEAADAV